MLFRSILPKSILKLVLLIFQEDEEVLEKLLEIKDCKMTIRTFIKLYKKLELKKVKSEFFTVRPSHTLRYGLRTRKSYLSKIPFMRELFVTGATFILKRKNKS